MLGIFIVGSHPLPLPSLFGNPVNPWHLGNAAQVKFKSGLQLWLQLQMSHHFGF
jgi:hypothetical protein